MTAWQLQKAKAHFSELVRRVKTQGPQAITVHGREEAVMLSKKDFDSLRGSKPNLLKFFRESPFHGLELKFERNKSISRQVKL